MTNNRFFKPLFFCGLFFLFASVLHAAAKPKVLEPTQEMATISRTASFLLTSHHFTQKKIDEELSEQLFDDFFKTLDPIRMFFTQQDIAQFEVSKKLLGSQIRKGDVQFAFNVFKLFLKRLDDYEHFTENYIKTNPSLNQEDEFEFNRAKLPWAADPAELHEIWKKKIRNDLILLELLDRSRNETTAFKDKKISSKPPRERTLQRIKQFLQHYREMEAIDVLELYLSSMTKVYDPHSEYMSPRSEEDFNITMKLSLVGIGALLTNEDGYTKIVKIIPGGPADLDGRLKAEDRIIAVAQEDSEPVDTLDMPVNKVVNLIRGKENTKVFLTVLEASKGSSAVPVVISLIRKNVRLQESEASGKVYDIPSKNGVKKRVAVLTLPSFYIDFAAAYQGDANYKSSTRDVANLIKKFSKDAPLDGLVIDLRTNGGGSLLEAVTLTGLFIKEGPVVQVRDQRGKKIEEDQDNGFVLYDGPLAVLTNRFSASAAEIFAGAIKDYQRGIILGDSKTHGKGTVQTLIELDRYTAFLGPKIPSGSIKLTNAKFYRINGASTQLRGITPDIIFPSFTDNMDIGEDKLPHAMRWDTIQPVEYQVVDPRLPSLIPILRERALSRVEHSKEFAALKHDIETFRKIRDRKTVSLNLEKRWKEYLAEKKLQDEQDKLLRLDADEPKKNTAKDLYLDETLNVMADYIDINAPKGKLAVGKQ
ncbi:MAG: Tail-specific protease precursor [Lentisphaerae bacterium ADurb.Bin242]|nr:MAG: Tail-specific protease precursor [Lentisphaerae bacterium ADurb.Bin242]